MPPLARRFFHRFLDEFFKLGQLLVKLRRLKGLSKAFLLRPILIELEKVTRVVCLVRSAVLFAQLTEVCQRSFLLLWDAIGRGTHTFTLALFFRISLVFLFRGFALLLCGLIFHHFLNIFKNGEKLSHTLWRHGVLRKIILILPGLRTHT